MNQFAALVGVLGLASLMQPFEKPVPGLGAAPAPLKLLWTAQDIGYVEGTSADGQSLYTLRNEDEITHLVVWDLRTGKRVQAHKLPFANFQTGTNLRRALSGDGRYFVCEPIETVGGASKGSTMLAVDLQTGKERTWDMSQLSSVARLQIDIDGQITRVHGYANKHTIDFKTGKVVDREPELKEINSKFVRRGAYDSRFTTPDGKLEGYWGSMKDHDVVRVVERATKKEVLTITGFWGTYPILSPDGKTLIVGTSEENRVLGKPHKSRVPGQLEIWSLSDFKRKATIPWKEVDDVHNGFDLQFSPDGRQVALWRGLFGGGASAESNLDSTIQFWEVSGKQIGKIEIQPLVRNGQYSPNGRLFLAFGGSDNAMHVFNAASLRLIWKLPGRSAHYPFWFTSDQRRIVYGREFAVEWREVATGKVSNIIPSNSRSLDQQLKSAGNGRYLIADEFRRADGTPVQPNVRKFGDDAKLVRLFRVIHVDSAREIFRTEGPGYSSFHFPADGKTMIQIGIQDETGIRDLTCWGLAAQH